jgi:hypothetical protein
MPDNAHHAQRRLGALAKQHVFRPSRPTHTCCLSQRPKHQKAPNRPESTQSSNEQRVEQAWPQPTNASSQHA